MIETDALRFSVFFLGLLLLVIAEHYWPRRTLILSRRQRWSTNLGLMALNSILLKLFGPVTAIAAAAWDSNNGWGMLALLPLPLWADLVLGVILLDVAIYAQHWLVHRVPILWRIHRVHHCDREFDVTTALRFHPIEIALSMLYKCLVVVLLGPLVLSVLLFEIILNASAMFNHANLKLPRRLDAFLRWIIVTPDMHRVHHSILKEETDSNYGFCLPWWDRILGTYRDAPKVGQLNMTIGLQEYQNELPSAFLWSLKLPINKS